MGKLEQLTSKFFKPVSDKKNENGLYASLDDLMNMRHYAAYLRFGKFNKTFANQAGEIRSAFKGRGIEMEELRKYGFGDDVRDIDWRVTARKETPYTRVYLEEKDREIYVWLDLSAIMMFGSVKELKSVTAAKAAALLGWFSLLNKDRFGCVIFDGAKSFVFKARGNRACLAAVLKKISSLSKEALKQRNLNDAERQKSLKLLQKTAGNRANVFLISSFEAWLSDFQADLAPLVRTNSVYLMDVFDKLERKAPPAGQYMVQWGDEKLVFDSSSKNYRRDYAAYFDSKRQKIQDFCRKFDCRFGEISSETGFVGKMKIF